ncbi:MAG TPA: thiamine phosphate synthase, partial [Pyrinomonadaceae bacterium]|nr:thiamine phosphate synthase [Pyrinomonadaceae bacterium]
ESKRAYGEPQGLDKLAEVASELGEFPVVAIGGITLDNVDKCLQAGARGIAAIGMLSDAEKMNDRINEILTGFTCSS